MILGLSLLALVSCGQHEEADRPQPTPGEEVRFGGTLGKGTLTRTVYGEEAHNAFPIYWVQDDQVLITSPQCQAGRNTATYRVSVNGDQQASVSNLSKTAAAGVQWGENATADFYSVYPAAGATVAGSKFTLTMPNVQRDQVEVDNQTAHADMNACFMVARTTGVPNGAEVPLTYQPLSTALRFTLRGPSASMAGTDSKVIISKVVLRADVPIAGDFTVDLSGATPQVQAGVNTSREITLYTYYSATGGYLTLATGEAVELNAFIIPTDGISINDNWQLEVTTSDNTVYTTTLRGSGNARLVAGQVHRVKGMLPSLPAPTEEWSPANWMVNIPRNVYLSEISIPGSWNSLNSDFQNVTGTSDDQQKVAIDKQYNAGVRAFHIDTRWKGTQNFWGDLSITGFSVANGGDTHADGFLNTGEKIMYDDNISFETALSSITSHVQPREYMMVFCTWAQDSYVNPEKSWMQAVSDACAANDKVIDGRTLTPNSVVSDVLGKVIVIVNCESLDDSTRLPKDSKCLFTFMPQTLSKANYQASQFNHGKVRNCNGASGINFYCAQAQIMSGGSSGYTNPDGRGYAPTMAERKTKAENILNWSMNNFGRSDYAHDDWMYHGLGGYCVKSLSSSKPLDKTTYDDVAKELNLWMDAKIQNMSANPTGSQTRYYPVGLVLMNKVLNTEYGTNVVKDILTLNNKYRKAYDSNRSPLDSDKQSDVNSAAPGYDSGMKDTGTNAIGWTRSH